MIIQTGMRTNIPAFYHEWLLNRIREGYVLVRNPYNPGSVTSVLTHLYLALLPPTQKWQ